MKAILNYSEPSKDTWRAYEQLWEMSTNKPVFESPSLLKYFAKLAKGTVANFRYYRDDEQLIGAAFFHKANNVYSFLSDFKTDHSCFVLHRDCTETEIEGFFRGFHKTVKQENWSLVLNNNPMWVSYMDTFTQVGEESSLFWLSAQSSVCPRLEEKSPDSLLRNLTKSRNNRYKRNRLIREQDASFEILEGDENLDDWATAFANTHVKRWNGTLTPSKYRLKKHRQLLLGCLKAWAQDGRLVRFALKAGKTRIAFVIGLRQQNSLIYHALTYHPDFHKYSPGKVLLLYLGEWMHENKLNILDFGDGNEPYKYNFANKERELHSIFISKKHKILFILKARLTAMVRNNSAVIQLYRDKLRPAFKLLKSRIYNLVLSSKLISFIDISEVNSLAILL
jgi:hypothetical protein